MSKRRFKPIRSQRTEKRDDDTPQKRPLDGQIKKTKTFHGQNKEPAFKKIEYPKSFYQITDFGKAFIKACNNTQ